jgi:hypothetical protein
MALPRRTTHTKKLMVSSSDAANERFVQYLNTTLIKEIMAITAKRKAPRYSSKCLFIASNMVFINNEVA